MADLFLNMVDLNTLKLENMEAELAKLEQLQSTLNGPDNTMCNLTSPNYGYLPVDSNGRIYNVSCFSYNSIGLDMVGRLMDTFKGFYLPTSTIMRLKYFEISPTDKYLRDALTTIVDRRVTHIQNIIKRQTHRLWNMNNTSKILLCYLCIELH